MFGGNHVNSSDWGALAPFINIFSDLFTLFGILIVVCVAFVLLSYGLLLLASVIARCKIFSKAGVPVWAAFVPVYSTYCLSKILYRNGNWGLLILVPFINIILRCKMSYDIVKVFNGPTYLAILNIFFTPIIDCIIAFGRYTYTYTTQIFKF